MRPKVYLAGAMEYSEDVGAGWRLEAQEKFQQSNIIVFNPFLDESNIFDKFEFTDHHHFYAAKINNFSKFKKCMQEIAIADLIELAKSDYVLAYITPTLGGGTPGEMTVARYIMNIPVIGVLDPTCEIKSTSGWVMASCDEIFTSLDEAINSIKNRIEACNTKQSSVSDSQPE